MNSNLSFRFRKYLLPVLGCLLGLCLLLAAFVLLDPHGCRIAPNVRVGGLDIGGMTVQDAYRTLDAAGKSVLEGSTMTLELPEETIPLSSADSGVRLRTLKALLAAFCVERIGSNDHAIGLESFLKLDKKAIRSLLADYADRYDTVLTEGSWWTSGPMPELSTLQTPDEISCQTLQIKLGTPTATLDQEDAFRRILAVYDRAFSAAEAGEYTVRDFRVEVSETPEEPDLKAIYEKLYVAPVNDSLDMENHCPISGSYGYSFNMKTARRLVRQAEYGEICSLSMECISPEIIGEGVYFRDVLGSCETPHSKDENRNNNLRQACASMNGKILQPGEVFSYNETLGPRTKENGYLKAGAYSGWELVMSYGGGICQGSSTIYCAALYADLEIVYRVNHGKKVSYMDAGLDATVSWNGPDFQFRNNTNFPIKIAAEVSDGYVKVSLLGTEERDYYIEMETESAWGDGVQYTKSYKCKYDRQTGELISRELEARSNYSM